MRFLAFVAGLLSVSIVSSYAQQVGTCETGRSGAFLDANNVRAAVYNAGNLFWKGSDNVYTVPKDGSANAIFAANLWIGGLVGGELRFTGTTYGPFAFFPGPLTENGELPNPSDCSEYDRIYEVTRREISLLDDTGEATADLRDWPWQLGAPVEDGDGNPDNYDLSAGDRPAITGHEMHWWIMNDLAGPSRWSDAPPLGVEVRSSAFAVQSTEPALDNTTFYRYEITNAQSYTIDSAYVGLWVDVDLGNSQDDLVGSDTSLGMGFGYNGRDVDEGSTGYGDSPPALGVDFVQGPHAEDDEVDNDRDGLIDEAGERRQMTALMFYNNDSAPVGDPRSASDAYGFMRAIWRDGTHVTEGSLGYGGEKPTNFFWPGDPVTRSFWSLENLDGNGLRGSPLKMLFIISAGPFTLAPGETEEIVLAIVWARGSDRLNSVTELRKADQIVQNVWDAGTLDATETPPVPTAGPALRSPAAGVAGQPLDVTLTWQRQEHMSDYVLEVADSPDFSGASRQTYTTIDTSVDVVGLAPFTDTYWRVVGRSPVFASPPSETRRFRTSDVTLPSVGIQMIPGTDDPAFVEVRGPGGVDPCRSDAVSADGCTETGGNLVYGSENSTGEYIMHHGGSRPLYDLANFAPNDFEIRFTGEGSYALGFTTSNAVVWVPFEVWDVGPVGFFNENDASDDVQLIPMLFSPGGGFCEFGYGEGGDDPFGMGWKMSDLIYAYYANSGYDEWENAVESLVEESTNRCYEPSDPDSETYGDLIDFARGEPLRQYVFYGDAADASAPGEGTVVRFYTTPSPDHAPIPAAPASGTGPFDQPMELVWNAPRGIATSQLQISADATFETPVFDATTKDESFVISGLEEGVTYFWRVRLSEPESPWSDAWTFTAGEVTNVSIEAATELPAELALDQNYPNPFNPSTTIRFGLPEAGPVQIEVYDLLGRRVATVVDGTFAAGWHNVPWTATGLASGMYAYTIQSEEHRRTRSMILLR